MKLCSHCAATYDDRVEFCFADGTPLRKATAAEVASRTTPAPLPPASPTDMVEPKNLRFDDVPEPQFLRALPPRGPAPITDSPTVPVPLDQAAPIVEAALPAVDDDEPAPPRKPLPSTQDTMPLPTPPLQRGQDWDDDPSEPPPPEPEVSIDTGLGAPNERGFGSYNPAETAPFSPSVGQESFGHPTMVPDEDPVAPSLEEPEEESSFESSWPEPDLEEPQDRGGGGGMMMALLGVGLVALIGGGGFMLWKNGQPPPPSEEVAAATPAEPEKAPVKPEPAPPKTKAPPKAEPPPEPPPEADPEPPPEPDAEPVVAEVSPERPDRVVIEPEPQDATPAKPPPTSTALLSVSTDPPGAVVFIDNVRAGQSPVSREVTVGNHSVRAEMAGYVNQTLMVEARDGGSNARIDLKPEPKSEVIVKLYGQPGSQVFVDGKNAGTLPVSYPLSPGSHSFRIVTMNGVTYEVTRQIEATTASVSLLAD